MSKEPSASISHLSPPYSPDVEIAVSRMMPKDRGVEPLKLFRTFVRNLPFTKAMGPLGGFMLSAREKGGAAFDLRSREIAIDRVCARCSCEYEWGVHVASYQRKAELTDEQVYSTVHGTGLDTCWSDKDRAVMNMVDQLHDTGGLSDDAFTTLAEHFDSNQMMELFALSGWYHAISYMANGMGTELEEWAPRFPARRP